MKIVFALLIIFFVFTIFLMANKQQDYPSKEEQLVNSILAKSAKIIRDKYNLKPCGAGAAMPGGPIQQLMLCFETKLPYNKGQLRELIIKSAQELVKHVNESNEIQEFIKESPFNLNNVQIIIYNSDKDGREVYDPEISTVEISQGRLTYQTVDSSDTFNYKNEYEETYEEALKALSVP